MYKLHPIFHSAYIDYEWLNAIYWYFYFLTYFRASKILKSLVNLNKAKDCHYLKTLHLNFIPYWLSVSFLCSRKFLHKSLKKIAALIDFYDYHLLGWAYEPSKRPTFQTLKIDLCDILHTEQVKSSSNSSSKSPFTFSKYISIIYNIALLGFGYPK